MASATKTATLGGPQAFEGPATSSFTEVRKLLLLLALRYSSRQGRLWRGARDVVAPGAKVREVPLWYKNLSASPQSSQATAATTAFSSCSPGSAVWVPLGGGARELAVGTFLHGWGLHWVPPPPMLALLALVKMAALALPP